MASAMVIRSTKRLLGGGGGHPRQRVLEGGDEVRHRQLGDDELLPGISSPEEIAHEDVRPSTGRYRAQPRPPPP